MLHNRLTKNNTGVTLIEVIAVVAILGVVMAAVTGFMISGTKMSAKVSGTATDSMKEQTAVEFINRRLWEANSAPAFSEDCQITVESEEKTLHKKITLGSASLYTIAESEPENQTFVVYCIEGKEPIKLCPGAIYFESTDDNVVIYYLDVDLDLDFSSEKHVVHLRIAPQD